MKWRDEKDFDEELRAHLELLEAEYLASGLDAKEAHRRALIDLGGFTQVKERVREARPGFWLSGLAQDLRFALRLLRKSPGFAAASILTLALGVGSISTLVSIVYGGIWRSDVPNADRWVAVLAADPDRNLNTYRFSEPELRDVMQSHLFEAVGAIVGSPLTLQSGQFPEHVGGALLSREVIPMLGSMPLLGRNFSDDEDRPGGPRVAIITAELWETAFARDPNILGRAIRIDGEERTVVGVMPPHYGLWGAKVYLPLQADLTRLDRGDRRIWITAILRKGESEAEAATSLTAVAQQWRKQFPRPEYRKQRLFVRNIRNWVHAGAMPAVEALLAAVALLLIICSANLCGLLLARGSARGREISVRLALGASRGRIVRQLLTESVLLSSLGGGLGVLLSLAGIPLALSLIPYDYIGKEGIRLEPLAVIGSVAISALVGIGAGLLPALRAGTIARTTLGLSRQVLIVCEVALAVVLLASAALVLRSYQKLMSLDLGFHPERMISMVIDLPATTNPGPFHRALLSRVNALPGVDGAALTTGQPLVDRITDRTRQDFAVVGRELPDARRPFADIAFVTPGYFEVMGIPLLGGRAFSDADDPGGTLYAIVNATLAREQWPRENPIGQRIRLGQLTASRTGSPASAADREVVVIGVAADSRQLRYIEVPLGPQIYLSALQHPERARSVTLLLRSPLGVAAIAASVRAAMLSIDPGQSIYAVSTMDTLVTDAFGPRRLTSALLAFFAVLALVLVVGGVYAVLAFEVVQRTSEIGLRLAIGASSRDVLGLFLNRGLKLALIGSLLGVLVVLAATKILQQVVYEISPHDPLTLAIILALVLVVALAASLLPARRATKIDPMLALRIE
jgi:putative ABC transport system permease protein